MALSLMASAFLLLRQTYDDGSVVVTIANTLLTRRVGGDLVRSCIAIRHMHSVALSTAAHTDGPSLGTHVHDSTNMVYALICITCVRAYAYNCQCNTSKCHMNE